MKADLDSVAKAIKEESKETRRYVDRTLKQLRHLYDLI